MWLNFHPGISQINLLANNYLGILLIIERFLTVNFSDNKKQ